MFKSTKFFVASLFLSFFFVPVVSFAQSVPSSGVECLRLNNDLTYGSKSSDVFNLQTFLTAKGYLTSYFSGGFGYYTAVAVNAFQLENKLTVRSSKTFGSVIVDQATRNKIASLTCVSIPLTNTSIDVFLVAGQSNALGQGYPTASDTLSLPSSGDILRYYDGKFAPVIESQAWPAFGRTYNSLTGKRILFVSTAVGGTGQNAKAESGNGNWDVSGLLFDNSVVSLDAALASIKKDGYTPNFKGILWVQGENDAIRINSKVMTVDDYKNALITMLSRYRAHYGPATPFYIFQTGTGLDQDDTGYAAVRNVQAEIPRSDVYSKVVFTGAVNFPVQGLMSDQYHYTQEGYTIMGTTGAQNVVAQANIPVSPAVVPTCSDPYAYYYYNNPDVKVAAGANPTNEFAFTHWKNYGFKEGPRISCWCDASVSVTMFNQCITLPGKDSLTDAQAYSYFTQNAVYDQNFYAGADYFGGRYNVDAQIKFGKYHWKNFGYDEVLKNPKARIIEFLKVSSNQSKSSLALMTNASQPTVLGDFVSSVSCTDLPMNLYRGMEKPSVTKLQDFLTQKGLLVGPSTGFYGDKTVEAVKDYQASKGLPLTGMVYGFTREAIRAESCQ